jgi:hypothetical protein
MESSRNAFRDKDMSSSPSLMERRNQPNRTCTLVAPKPEAKPKLPSLAPNDNTSSSLNVCTHSLARYPVYVIEPLYVLN